MFDSASALIVDKLARFAKSLVKKYLPDRRFTSPCSSINYRQSPLSIFQLGAIFSGYFGTCLMAFYIFYRNLAVGAVAALIIACSLMPVKINSSIIRRKKQFRRQFLDLMTALDVAMRAGENINNAFNSALKSLLLIYNEKSDIVIEIKQILMWMENNRPLKESLGNLAKRCQIEEIKSFATVIALIEGKSDKSDEVIRKTHQVIARSIEIEMEIETIIADKKNEQLIMLVLPVIIVGVMTFLGDGFMDTIHTTFIGRLITTSAIVIFILSYALSLKITKIDV